MCCNSGIFSYFYWLVFSSSLSCWFRFAAYGLSVPLLLSLSACGLDEDAYYPSEQEAQVRAAAEGATYYNDTELIIDQYCVSCHYPQSPLAPFSLETYEDVVAKQSAIIYSLKADTMPTPGSLDLSSEAFDLLLGWLLNGAPSGVGDSAPIANASVDQNVTEGQLVTLDGTLSSDDGDISSYLWEQTLGVPVSLNVVTAASPQFTAPSVSSAEVLEFMLTVTDTAGQTASDRVRVVVNLLDLAPVANAGVDQEVGENVSVTLDGSASTDDGIIQSYLWTQSIGPAVSLLNASSASTTFESPAITSDTLFVFALTVTDSAGQNANDTVQVKVINDAAPMANAGPNQSVTELTTVSLDGSGSSDDVAISTYAWTQTGGTNVALSSPASSTSSFVAPDIVDTGSELLTFQLAVTDSAGQSAIATVQVTVNGVTADPAPVSSAGADQAVFEGQTVTLDGSTSSDNSNITNYNWLQISGTPVSLVLVSAEVRSFSAPTVASTQLLEFQLTVTDDNAQTSSDTVQITVNNDQPPIVVAGINQIVNEEDLVTLDGSASTDDIGISTYFWQQVSGSSVSLSVSGVASRSFTAPNVLNDEQLVFELSVTDSAGQVSSGSVQVSVNNDDPPIAHAGSDQAVDEGALVSLNGSASSDDVEISIFSWQQTSGTTAVLSDASVAEPNFTAPDISADEVLIFQLTVTDSSNQTASDTVQVSVNATTAYSYNGDIKAIIDASCTGCHAPGEIRSSAPLTSYSEVMLYINDIATRVESGNMPKPPTSLSAQDKNSLLDWIAGGSPEN